jgi:BioD-like phosphotransacetylase family protein
MPSNAKYVGMDVHKSITVIAVLNALSQVETRSQVKTKAENLSDYFRGLSGRVEGSIDNDCRLSMASDTPNTARLAVRKHSGRQVRGKLFS